MTICFIPDFTFIFMREDITTVWIGGGGGGGGGARSLSTTKNVKSPTYTKQNK
jgi:hypothetical protein